MDLTIRKEKKRKGKGKGKKFRNSLVLKNVGFYGTLIYC